MLCLVPGLSYYRHNTTVSIIRRCDKSSVLYGTINENGDNFRQLKIKYFKICIPLAGDRKPITMVDIIGTRLVFS